jgi:4-hydroxy-3-polyprenylbenzoate decarboxylase
MKPDRDLIVIPRVRADRSEPLELEGTVAKLAIDATRREDDRSDWRIAEPPEPAIRRAKELLRDAFASPPATSAATKTS